ncbi:DUF2398 family protein [Streptomyces sp. ISL-98]|nr:DUF2398 family protein [Streptomyces sp. ISL-98]
MLRHFDATVRRERFDLVAMVRLLGKHGVIPPPTREAVMTREEEKDYAAGNGNALYDVDHRTAALMPACPVPPTPAGGTGRPDTRRPGQPMPEHRSGPSGSGRRRCSERRCLERRWPAWLALFVTACS